MPTAGTRLVRLGPVEGTLAVTGLLAFISSFLPWYQVSASAPDLGVSYRASTNAWNSGIGAWLPVLLLMVLGVLAVLPAFGVSVKLRGGHLLFALAGALAAVIIVIRWATYPSFGSAYGVDASSGAGIGTFLGLAAALVATALAARGFVKDGGSFGRFGEAFARKDSGAN